MGRADVIVLSNRTRAAISFEILVHDPWSRSLEVSAHALTVLPLRGPCELAFTTQGVRTQHQLDANAVYVFREDPQGRVDISQIDLGINDQTAGGRTLGEGPPLRTVVEIPIEVFVDSYELTVRDVWEARLRKRIDRVSDILEQYCRVRLKVVDVGEWTASAEAAAFPLALAEFQQAVQPRAGHVAIGFTGRYREPLGVSHLGGTPGMLQRHILVREWSATMSEPEREEVLLHEVGHYLGAVHSPDRGSVMRPVLADNQALRADFRIAFDPVNTLLINLVGEEIRERRVTAVSELTAATRLRLSQIYAKLADAIPADTSAKQYQFQLGMMGDTPLADATRLVVAAVRTAALARAARAGSLRDDRLTEYYVRCAAAAAEGVPADVAPAAFLLGVGIALDDSDTLTQNRLTREFSLVVETPAEREQRCRTLAGPTILNRRDLAQHFFLSAYLTAVVGPLAAETAGVGKELADARSGRGFSYVDLAADLAGIAFAQRVLRRQPRLDELARQFEVAQFMPRVDGLPEGLAWEDLLSDGQGSGLPILTDHYRSIRDRLTQLPAAPPAEGRPARE